jgi:hypothetical protein
MKKMVPDRTQIPSSNTDNEISDVTHVTHVTPAEATADLPSEKERDRYKRTSLTDEQRLKYTKPIKPQHMHNTSTR